MSAPLPSEERVAGRFCLGHAETELRGQGDEHPGAGKHDRAPASGVSLLGRGIQPGGDGGAYGDRATGGRAAFTESAKEDAGIGKVGGVKMAILSLVTIEEVDKERNDF